MIASPSTYPCQSVSQSFIQIGDCYRISELCELVCLISFFIVATKNSISRPLWRPDQRLWWGELGVYWGRHARMWFTTQAHKLLVDCPALIFTVLYLSTLLGKTHANKICVQTEFCQIAFQPLKQTDALWELFSPKISQFFKTAVLTLGNDILTKTMVKLCS